MPLYLSSDVRELFAPTFVPDTNGNTSILARDGLYAVNYTDLDNPKVALENLTQFMPVTSAGYTFQAPRDWGTRPVVGEPSNTTLAARLHSGRNPRGQTALLFAAEGCPRGLTAQGFPSSVPSSPHGPAASRSLFTRGRSRLPRRNPEMNGKSGERNLERCRCPLLGAAVLGASVLRGGFRGCFHSGAYTSALGSALR